MDCKDFRNIVIDLFDKDVDPQIKAECKKHISQCAECKAYYESLQTTARLLRPKHSPVAKSEKIEPNSSLFALHSLLFKVAASFIGIIMLSGIAFATYHVTITSNQTEEPKVDKKFADKKMLMAFILPKDAAEWQKKRIGDGICVSWCKGTWVVNDNDSYIEEHPICRMPYMFRVKYTTVRLDGKMLDVHKLPDLPASALKKMEIHYNEEGYGTVHLSTKPVQIPLGIKGNINPDLSILLTGTPPKEAKIRSCIYVKEGIRDSYDWKDYVYTSWTDKVENISMKLEEVAIRKDHHVRVNVCKGVSLEHINRLKKLMRENGVTNYELINQK